MVSKGATTSWERWDTDTQDGGMNGESQKILSGNLEAWMYQTLGGINYDPERPGFKHIILRPRPVGDLTFVRASHRSLYGPIVSDWKIEGGRIRLDRGGASEHDGDRLRAGEGCSGRDRGEQARRPRPRVCDSCGWTGSAVFRSVRGTLSIRVGSVATSHSRIVTVPKRKEATCETAASSRTSANGLKIDEVWKLLLTTVIARPSVLRMCW